ncbi:MAG: hypothetical protein QF814_01010 [Candidatus Marinimicrobia bacterium]|nr:hypothetical protein [Candidatus Neomarinimicrobiota bacterium]HJM47996.1 hypothetical protein [Candidatus Neomarinimicrobiota bacterium]
MRIRYKDGRDYTIGNQFGYLAFHVDDLDRVITDVKTIIGLLWAEKILSK